MVKQKKRKCIKQWGKNYAINCAIQGVRLIWKQKIWLAICKFLWSLTNHNAWFVSSFCTELTLYCTVFEENCTALNRSKWRNFFMYIISIKTKGYWIWSPLWKRSMRRTIWVLSKSKVCFAKAESAVPLWCRSNKRTRTPVFITTCIYLFLLYYFPFFHCPIP